MSYEEAAEKEEWKKAMVEEMQSRKNGTWDMVDLPNEKFYQFDEDLQEEIYVTQPDS